MSTSNLGQVAADTWRATLREVQTQACRQSEQSGREMQSGGWVEVDPSDAVPPAAASWSDVWPQHQWCIAFEILFCQEPAAISALRPPQDDLLLFVYFTDVALLKDSPVFARRRSASLPEDLRWGSGGRHLEVNWRETLLLNVVVQTAYTLTMQRCDRREVAEDDFGTAGWSPPCGSADVIIVRVVHASPARVQVNLDQSKASSTQPQASYPDVCFSVDDFADACKPLVLAHPDDCYCVVLRADVARSWGRAAAAQPGLHTDAAEAAATAVAAAPAAEVPSPDSGVILWSGYVTRAALSQALSRWLRSPVRALKPDDPGLARVVMKGPGGVGAADVAVTHIKDVHMPGSDTQEPPHRKSQGKQGSPLPALLNKASLMARGVVAAAKAVAHGGGVSGAVDDAQLRCALMTLAVPVETLAEGIMQAL